ncbi:hypothetical protein HNQ57_001998 [Zhongshania antarctica]|uniref:Uncharacterized protein n=1 Tax=Zhongshania antarctica TaxID=641702 RepID=A0A840R5N3_9GAMM|nr:hypothetical protein [Zhongshania antarctica]MBB5187720.1 hypothetical protein [Zhongshania antarctica]
MREISYSLGSFFYLILVAVIVVLPTGYVYGVPIKHLIVLPMAFFFLVSLSWLKLSEIVLVFSYFVFAIIYFLIGMGSYQGANFVLDESLLYLGFVTVYLFGIFIFDRGGFSRNTFLTVVVYSSFFYSIVKLVLVVLVATEVISFEDLLLFFTNNLNYRFVSSSIAAGVVRISVIGNDLIVLFSLILVLEGVVGRGLLKLILISVLFLCIIFAFSRLLFFALALYYMVFSSARAKIATTIVFVFVFFVLMSSYQSEIISAFEYRFTSEDNSVSDGARFHQSDFLIAEISKNPVFGCGFGCFSRDYIRDQKVPFSYEVHWLSLAMKFGVAGILGYLYLFYYSLRAVRVKSISRDDFLAIYILSIVVLGGLTNQLLMSTGTSVALLLVCIFSSHSNSRERV